MDHSWITISQAPAEDVCWLGTAKPMVGRWATCRRPTWACFSLTIRESRRRSR